MKPSIKEMQERIYCEISETNGNINWVSFYDTEEEYECQFDFTLEEIEEAKEIVAKHYEYDRREEETYEYWLAWENKVIENHYNEIKEIEEEEEIEEVFLRDWELSILRNRR